MEDKLTNSAFKELCDVYLIPGMKREADRLMVEHVKRYHQGGAGVNLTVAGIDLNIKEHK